jgi:acyl carrier protein
VKKQSHTRANKNQNISNLRRIKQMVFEKVVDILRNYKEEPELEISMESTFEELELDSLDTVELVMEIEEAFDTSIEMDTELKTIADVVGLIEQAIA